MTGGREPLEPSPMCEPTAAEPRRGTVAILGALVLVLVLGLLQQPPRPAPAPAPAVEASLSVLVDRIATSQSGVLVVPVETDNRGPAVAVDELVLWAEPVRQDPATNGVRRIGAASTGGFAAIVQPDCGVLALSSGITFVATVTVGLRTDAGVRRDLVLDLARDPGVAARVASLCGVDPAPRVPAPPS